MPRLLGMGYGEWFKAARKSRGMTQVQLSQAVSCDPSTISRIERDEVIPSLKIAQAIAHKCGVSLPDFFREQDESSSRHSTAPPSAA